MTDTLYDRDFVTWTERQAETLRRLGREGANLPLDWENLAEEIETLGRSDRREVGSLASATLVHLLKLACSPAAGPRAGWMKEVDGFRRQLVVRLGESPSLAASFQATVDAETAGAFKATRRSLERHGEEAALPRLEAWEARGIAAEEILADGLYPDREHVAMVRDET